MIPALCGFWGRERIKVNPTAYANGTGAAPPPREACPVSGGPSSLRGSFLQRIVPSRLFTFIQGYESVRACGKLPWLRKRSAHLKKVTALRQR